MTAPKTIGGIYGKAGTGKSRPAPKPKAPARAPKKSSAIAALENPGFIVKRKSI